MISRALFIERATSAGFTEDQAEFLYSEISMRGHSHDIEDVYGLSEALMEAGVAEDEEEGEED